MEGCELRFYDFQTLFATEFRTRFTQTAPFLYVKSETSKENNCDVLNATDMLNVTCWAFESCHAMRQQEKQEKDQENWKENLWARQYSDDVFIEDPLPTIKPRWRKKLEWQI